MGGSKAFDPEGDGYDDEKASELIKLYPLKIKKPTKYVGDYVTDGDAFQAWVWHPEKNDYLLHSASRDPRTGQILKGKKHPTFKMTEEGEISAGYEIYKGRDGKYYSIMKTKELE